MSTIATVVVNEPTDERVVQRIAEALRANGQYAKQIRDFADMLEDNQHPLGLKFQPKPGQLLVCRFGLGFQQPEMVKTRPVLVVSPHQRRWTGLCLVVPISSVPPDPVEPYHYRLPDGLLPSKKYPEAWIKGDLVITVGKHRLDRIKTGFRQYEAPLVPPEVLREARRCILHATGMHTLTAHL
ncbi:MAG: type II toxin-antitoxin system PemK/MazF family toxin [Rhodospirillales bacterium]